MPTFNSPAGASGEDPVEPMQDPKLRRAFDQLHHAGAPLAPSSAVDHAILEHARRAPGGGRWIWPASLAASLLLCATVVLQLAKVVQPQPPAGLSGGETLISAPGMMRSADLPVPAVGGTSDANDAGSISARVAPAPSPDSAEFWWEQLRLHARNADRAGFLATWEVYQQHRGDTPLPADLRRWMADNQVPLNSHSDG